ncbi:MAG: PTS sugar transporter subunit IIA [Treponemataceae bacterium]
MQLSVKDAATIFNVSEKQIYQWIKQEEIPFHNINDQFRLNRAELMEWATRRGIEVSADLFRETESTGFPLPTFSDALNAGGVAFKVGGVDRKSVFKSIVAVMKLPEEIDRDFLFEVLLARETLGSTGIGDGIAIPHVRNPVVLHVAEPRVVLCFLENPIDFSAIDGKPVDTLFTLISPSVRVHLHLLSRLGFILRDPEFKAALKKKASKEELMKNLLRAEKAIPASKDEKNGSK